MPPSSSAQTFDQGKLVVQGAEETIKALTEAVRTKGAWKAVRDLDGESAKVYERHPICDARTDILISLNQIIWKTRRWTG